MSKTRKLLLVLLSLCFAVSLCLGVTVVSFAEGETAVTVSGVTTTESPFVNNGFTMRVDIATNATNLGNGSENLTYTSGTQSGITYSRGSASSVVGAIHGGGSNVILYFRNPDGATFESGVSEEGDILTIGAGFVFTNKDGTSYIVEETVAYEYDGSAWQVTEVSEEPAEGTQISWPDIFTADDWQGDMELRLPSNLENNNQGLLTYDSSMLSLVKITRGDTTYACSHIYEWGGEITFYFNNSGYTGKTAPQDGDVLSVDAGLTVTNRNGVAYVNNEAVSWTYDSTSERWMKDGVTVEATEIELADIIETSDWNSNTEVRIPSNLQNLNNQQLTYDASMLDLIEITRGDTAYACTHIYEWNGDLTFYFNGSGYTGLTPQTGDKLTIGAGLLVTNRSNIDYTTSEDISFTYDGVRWIKDGVTVTEISWPSSIAASDWNSDTEVRIPSNLENNNEQQLTYSSSMLGLVEITRGDTTFACSHIYEWGGKITFYFNGSGYTGKSAPMAGDVLTIGAGLIVTNKNGITYYNPETISYVCDGVGWIQPREIPDRDYESLTPITIESITTTDIVGNKTDSVFYINTTSSNTQDFGDADYDETYTMLPYISFVYPNGNIGDVWCVRVNGSVARLFIHEPGSQTNLNANTIPEGGVLTIRAGFGILATEALQEDISFVYNGEEFVELVAPDSADDYTIATPNNTTVKVGEDLQIVVDDGDTINAYYRYSVSDTSIATISSLGVLRGVKAGTVTVSVWYGDFEAKTVDIVVEALEQNDIASFEVVSDIDTFRIPVASSDWTGGNYFWEIVVEQGGYVLMGQYTLNSGTIINVEILEDEIADIDFSVAGTYALLVTDDLSGLTYELEIEIFTPREVGTYSSLGVSGYDVSDDRNASGTWNGHMMVGMNQYSTNTRNMTGSGTAELNALKDIASYIVYERADGTTYQNTNDDSPISVWQVSSNLLIMIRPDGYTGTKGYGVDSATGEDIPIYQQGDTITFKAGMPIYLYVGNSTNTEGYYVVEGVRTEDVTYYCYEDNGESSLWQLYIEYTDFTVDETMEIEVNSAVPVGATRVPADATTGTFSYKSSDTSVVTINSTGTMVGMKAGTATITITLTGGKDAEGNDLAPITKTVQVTVVRGIDSVSGSITLTQNSTPDLSQYNITVTYTDGTTEEIPLNDERVVLQQDIDTSELGETTYNVLVTVGDTQARGTLTVTIVAESGGCSGSAIGAASVGIGVALLLSAGALLVVRKKKQK